MEEISTSGRPSLSPGLAVQESALFLLVLYAPSEKKGAWRERILGGSIFGAEDDAAAAWGLRICADKSHPKATDGYRYCEPAIREPAALRLMLEVRGGDEVAVTLQTPFWEKHFRYAIVRTAFFE